MVKITALITIWFQSNRFSNSLAQASTWADRYIAQPMNNRIDSISLMPRWWLKRRSARSPRLATVPISAMPRSFLPMTR